MSDYEPDPLGMTVLGTDYEQDGGAAPELPRPYSDGGDIEDAEYLERQVRADFEVADFEVRPYDDARNTALLALERTRELLGALRGERERVNARIRQLVADEQLLASMVRVTARQADA